MKFIKKIISTVSLFLLLLPYLNFPIKAQAQTAFSVQIIGTTNTQAILKYTAPDANACKVEVSESPSYSPLVHDVNASLFTGANMDSRETALSGGNLRIFVVGKRMVEKGLDGNNYSRALQTNTTHYYRVTCGTTIVTGNFATANIPFGMTYADGLQNNPDDRAGYMFPTVSTSDRNTSFIDPRTGTLFKPLALQADGAIVYNYTSFGWSSAGFHEWCSPKVSANGFYHCALPNDWTWMLYGIHQTTGEVRYLGSMHFAGQGYGVSEGFRGCYTLAGMPWDVNDPNVYYCGEYSSVNRDLVILKMTYTGNDQPVAQGLDYGGIPNQAPMSITNLTPYPNTLLKKLKDFDSSFDPTKFNCLLDGGNMAGYLAISCKRGEQDSFAWIGAYDVKNNKVAAFVKMWEQPKVRWCTHHSYEFLGNSPVMSVATQMPKGQQFEITLTNDLPGAVSAGTLTTARVTSSWNSAWGSQPAGWQEGDPVSPNGPDKYLMDLKVGDFLWAVNNNEHMEVVEIKSPTELVLKRGLGVDQSFYGPVAQAAGTKLLPYCNTGGNDLDLSYMFWRFLDAPRGGDANFFGPNFGSHPVHRGQYRGSEGAFKVGFPDDTSQWHLGYSGRINVSPKFAGAFMPADGNYFEKHASMPYEGTPWFLDMHPYNGGSFASSGSNNDTLSLGGNLYQYFYNGLDTPHYGGDGLNRKQAATFAFNGSNQMVDISGPGSVIGTGGEYNYTYCVVNKAGECVAGSQPGNIYFNVPSLSEKFCKGELFFGGQTNACIGDVPTIGFGITQNKFLNDTTGQAIRVLSKAFAFAHQSGTANVKVVPDGSWALVNSYTGHFLIMKIPPIPASDGIDRTTFVRAPLTLTPPTGKGITQAKVYFGYSEQGRPSDYYCTSRREACVSTTSTIVDSNPFSYATSDTYTNIPCTTSCSVTLPVLPMRTAYFKVSYLNASGVEVSTDNGVAVEKYVASLGTASNNNVSTPTTPTIPTTPTPVIVDTTPPVISNVTTSEITSTSATVTWNTNELADSQIEYGLTSAYGASAVDGTPATSHVLKFTNLTPNTKYSYRVTSEDLAGNTTVSYNQIFTTKEVVQTSTPTTSTQTTSTVTGTFASWLYKKNITINKSQVQGSLTNFPLLVSITDPDLRVVSSGGKVAKSDGSDFVFANNNDQKLSYEIEKYDASVGTLVAWVKIPTLSSDQDVGLNLYFGNQNASDQQDKNGVWDSNYKAVFHLSTDADDSTSNGNNGTEIGSPSKTLGQVGGGYGFNGANSRVTSGSNGFSSGSAQTTIQSWVNVTGLGNYGNGTFLFGYGPASYMKRIGLEAKWGAGQWSIVYGDQRLVAGTLSGWHHVAVLGQGTSSYSLYVDGSLATSGSLNSYGDYWALDPSTGLSIGGDGNTFSQAKIDEVRVSSVARSADWIKTEYNNQSSPSTFVTVGASENTKQVITETAPLIPSSPVSTGSPSVTFQNVAVIGSTGGGGGPSFSRTTTATSNTATTNQTTTQTSSGSISLPRDLVFGAKGSDVTLLQKTLVSSGYLPSDSATGYFGPLTLSAIKKYQQDKGLAGPGDRGWGNVGPQTRAHFAKLSGTVQTTNTLTPTQKAAIQAQINSLLTLVTKLMAQLQALQGR